MTEWIHVLLADAGSATLRHAFVAAAAAAAAIALLVAGLTPGVARRLLGRPAEPPFHRYLPFRSLDPDGATIVCRGKTIARVWHLRGLDHTGLTANGRHALHQARKTFLDHLEGTGLDLRLLTIRHRTPLPPDPPEAAASPVVSIVTRTWNEGLANHVYRNRHFLAAYAADSDAGRAALDDLGNHVDTTLADYEPLLLAAGRPARDDRPRSPLAPFSEIVNPVTRPDPEIAPDPRERHGPLAAALAAETLWVGPSGQYTFVHGDAEKHQRIIQIKGLAGTLSERAVQALISLHAELTIVHSFQPASAFATKRALGFEAVGAPAMMLGGKEAQKHFHDAITYIEGTGKDGVSGQIYPYGLAVLVYGDTADDAEQNAQQAERALRMHGLITVRGGFAADAAYWGALPTWDYLPRPWRLRTTDIALLLLPQTAPAGLHRHDWADRPLVTYLTSEGSTYGFAFHASEQAGASAHTAVIGPAGTGKTTLLSHIMTHMLALPGTRVRAFDRLRGMEVFTTALQGAYVDLFPDTANAVADGIALNPLLLEDTPPNRAFLRQWLAILSGPDLGDDDHAAIARAVGFVYEHLPPHMRSLRAIHTAAFPARSVPRRQLERWISPDQHGALFNAESDAAAAIRNRLIVYEMTTALQQDGVAPPLVSYLVHRIRAEDPGKPCLVMIDETEPMLADPHFFTFLKQGLQESRKLRHAYVICFQRPEAIADTDISQLVRGQCKTILFLRNPQASAADYAPFQLTDGELAFVLGHTHRELQWAVLCKRYEGAHTAILDVSLDPLGAWKNIYASSTDRVLRLRSLIGQHGHADALREFIRDAA